MSLDSEILENFKNTFTDIMKGEEKKDTKSLQITLDDTLSKISEDPITPPLDDFFTTLIDLVIELKPQDFFLNFKETFEIFKKYGFSSIPNNIIEKLIAAIQWKRLDPRWIQYYDIKDYYDKLLGTEELKSITWALVELVRITEEI